MGGRLVGHERVQAIPAASHRRDAGPEHRTDLPGDAGKAHHGGASHRRTQNFHRAA